MQLPEEFDEEQYNDEVESYSSDDDDDSNPREKAFLKGYEEADDIEAEWDFVGEAEED